MTVAARPGTRNLDQTPPPQWWWHAVENEGRDGETRDGITIEILRPRIVVTIEIKLKERGHRPDGDRGEERGITQVSMSILHDFFRQTQWSRA